MSSLTGVSLADVGLDAAALKPAEVEIARARDLAVETLVVDYEGHEHLPPKSTLVDLGTSRDVRLTMPVRADGFDPLGEDDRLRALPDSLDAVLVAGHPAYLDSEEETRPVAPRFDAAAGHVDDPWVGTEGVGRIALATGLTQFELLTGTTERDVRALRAAGFDGDIACYAPTVLSRSDDAILDAVGAYTARRQPVADALPDSASTDSHATDAARDTLLAACREYALVGTPSEVRERVQALRDAGVDTIVGYPARGLDPFLA
jgi:alkanesulfonate monooxygenase SsuD/methylene tetrahydromethanopterin reductase-like flavin-dependent oxidoreductase (luciferase family)